MFAQPQTKDSVYGSLKKLLDTFLWEFSSEFLKFLKICAGFFLRNARTNFQGISGSIHETIFERISEGTRVDNSEGIPGKKIFETNT